MMMIMLMMMMMIMIIIAVTQSIFKLGRPDFAWKQIQIISNIYDDDDDDDDDDEDDDDDNDCKHDDDDDGDAVDVIAETLSLDLCVTHHLIIL